MSADPLARRLSACALALAFLALVLGGWSVFRSESELRDLRRAVERATRGSPVLGPRPTLDEQF